MRLLGLSPISGVSSRLWPLSLRREFADPPHPALGLARYQEGELHRLYGDFEHAERDYREASRHGYDPMPGLASNFH